MKKSYTNDSEKNRTRKTKRWLGLLTFCMMIFVGQISFAQCINSTSFSPTTSNNSGDVQGITTCMYTSEYNQLSGLIIGSNYIFTATQDGVNVYITITDTSNTVIAHGPSPLTVNSITATSIRLHATDNASCGSSSTCTASTIQMMVACPQPESLNVINITENSADLAWTEINTATLWDIEWGTIGFTPTGTPNVTGVTSNPYTLTGLATGTLYQFYVRSDCGVDDGLSVWSGPFAFQTTADCSSSVLDITSTTGGNVCNEGTTTLQAVASGTGSEIYWYDAELGGSLVGEGASFETPFLTETTSYWASEVLHNNNLLSGQSFANPTTFTNSTGNNGVLFNVVLPMKIVDVEVFGTNATGGEITIELRDIDNGNQTVASTTATITGGGTAAAPIAHTIPLNFYVQPGNYRLVRASATPTGVGMGYVSATNSNFPYPLGDSGSVTGGATATGTSTIQYFFFNWTIEEISLLCFSDREETTATVHEIIDIDVTATETTIDAGDNTTLTASSTNSNYEYVWTWDGGTDTGASITVSPTEHTTYTVTATDTVTGCQTSEEIEILVYDMTLCNTIEILTTTDGNICDEGTVALNATASGTGSEIYWYDAAVGGNKVGEGATFETPELTETASYWAAEVYLDGETISGVGIVTPSGTGTNSTVNYGMQFTVTEPTTLVSVDVLSTANGGDLTIGLYDVSTSTYIASHVETIIGGQYHTIPLNFDVPAAGTYRLVRQAQSTTIALRSQNTTGTEYPYPIGTIGQLDGGHVSLPGVVNSGQYMFYNWDFSTAVVICESDREEVVASVHETIDMDVTATDTELLPGESATLSASSTNSNYEYVWTWDGGSATGASVTVSPTSISTTYTVTATDSVTGCQTQGSVEIFTFDDALCDDLDIATTTDGNVCGPGNTTTLQATGNSGVTDSQIFWYDAPTGGNKVGQGTDFTTPLLTATTSYWAAEVLTDGQEDLAGQGWLTDYGTNGVGTNRQGMIFEIFEHTTLVDLEVWSTGTGGVVDIELYDMANVVVGNHLELVTTTLATGTTTSPAVNTVTLNWELTPGVYKIVRAGSVPCRYISGVANFGGGYPIPFDNGIGQITAGSNTFASTGFATAYYYFFNWTLSTAEILCESEREEVTATVHDIIDIDVVATETTIDAGDNTTLTASSTNSNYEYVWTWDGGTDTGASITVSPTQHTTYTVTATDTVTGCQTLEEIEILVYDLTLCDDIEILTTTDGNICSEGTITLSATASGDGDEIYWYDAPTGGNLVGQGPTFETPELTETASYWASEVYLDSEIFTEQGNLSPTTLGSTTNGGITFVLNQTASILSFEARSTSAAGGAVTYALIDVDNSNSVLMTHSDTLPGGGTGVAPVLYTVNLNFYNIPPGNYRLIKQSGAASAYMTGGFPYPLGTVGQVVNGAGSATSTSTLYYHFFNITVEQAMPICESDREEVTATVHNIDVTATATTIDPGDSTTLTASSTNPNYTYVWTWDGGTATGASITVSPTDHTTYTVTATDTTEPSCQNSAEITIIVFNTALCNLLEVTSTTDGGVCESGTTVLQATGSGSGDNIYWYDAPTGGNIIGQGTEFTTPNLTTTTSFWASEVLLEDGGGTLSGLGQPSPSQNINSVTNGGLFFTATESFTFVSVEVHSSTAAGGEVVIGLRDIDNGNTIVASTTITLPPGGSAAAAIPVTVPLNFNVTPGNYRLVKESGAGMLYNGATTGAPGFPYLLGDVGTITGGATVTSTSTLYYFFYNWTISTGLLLCESDREEVIATVVPQSTTPIPTGDANQLVYAGTTLAGLDVTGTSLKWYSDAGLTNEIPDTTLAYEGTYYVTQTIGYCEGAALAVTVTLHCPTPNNLSTGIVTLNSAELLWQGNGVSFDIEWGLEGFVLGNGTEINNITGNTHLLNGLAPDTYYDFYVRQDCGTDGISNWGGPYTFFTGYCAVTSTSTNYGISNFTTTGGVLNINNSSSPGSYSNYTAQSVAQFEGGAPVQFTITSTNSTAGMGVWIDWNNNMVFDPGEQVYNSAAYVASGSGSITVPAGTPLGNYRMRVVANFLSQNPTSCGFLGSTSAIYGEAEDYTFMVIDPPACMPPIELTADVTATSADLGWTSTGTLFDIKWGASGFDVNTQGTLVEGVTNPYTLSGLDPSTTYQYYVRHDCTADDDGYSLWAGPFTFTTLCVPVSVLNENFDGITAGTGVLPVCWSKIGTSAAYVSTTTPFSAPNSLYMYKSTNVDNYLVTPYLDNLADNTHWLRFKARTTSTSSTTLTVGYLTDATDASTFVEIETITFVGTTYPSEDFIIFPWNLPADAKHLAFRNNINLRTIYLDDIHWEAAPDCMYPLSLSSANISASSTSLSWAGTGSLYDIEYGEIGFVPGSNDGTIIPGVSNPYTITNLTGGATYQYYVRQDCGDDGYSNWSGPFEFTPGAYQGNIPTMLNANPQVGDDACAVVPFSIEVPEGHYLSELSVTYTMISTPQYMAEVAQQRSVLYSPTLEMGEAQIAVGDQTYTYPGSQNYSRDITFALGATGTIEFVLKAWRTEGGASCNTDYIFVQDGTWILDFDTEPFPTCPIPTDLGITNITEASVDLIWISEAEGLYDLEWGAIGFTPEEGEEEGAFYAIDGTIQPITGLDSSITYEFYVRSNCSTDDEEDMSEWAGPFKFKSGYCEPISNQSRFITLFSTSGAEENITYTGATLPVGSVFGYRDRTDLVIVQQAGESFDFQSNYIGGQSGARIWVDWNKNFVFEDDEEVFYHGGSPLKSGTIEIPADILPGNYVIRVYYKSGASSVPTACENVVEGEAVDFTLSIPCSEVAAPIGEPMQTFTEGQTLADLDVAGNNLTWYADEDLTEVLEPTHELVHEATYYVVSSDGNCQSEALAITVTVIDPCADVLAPVAASPQSMTAEQTVADIDVDGDNLTWYSDSDLTTIVDDSFVLTEGSYTFWVTQTIEGCESEATEIQVEVTLSTDRFDTASFKAYPNPVRDFFNISYSDDITDVMVINMLGQTVISKAVNATDTQIDMSSLPTGTYFVKVNIDGIIKTIKVAKQ